MRNIADLAKLFDAHKKDNHCWVENKKFLLVPYHMIGARNMESAILGGYVDLVMDPKLPDIELPKPKPGLKQVGAGGKARMSNTESISETKSILQIAQETLGNSGFLGQSMLAQTKLDSSGSDSRADRLHGAILQPTGWLIHCVAARTGDCIANSTEVPAVA